MRGKAGVRGGRRAFGRGVALPVLLASVLAHADGEDEIARCARIPSTGDRILCLENALRRANPPEPPPAEVRAAPEAPEPPAASEVPATSPAAPAPSAAKSGFGLEASRHPDATPASIRVTVVAIDENAYGKLRYTTDDGQLWRQIDQRAPRYGDLPFTAEIRGAAAGSFFLQPVSGGIAVRVRRER